MIDLTYEAVAWFRNNSAQLLPFLGIFAALVLALSVALIVRLSARLAREERIEGDRARTLDAMLAELKGRVSQMSEMTAQRQEELTRTVNDRLDRVGVHLGTSVEESGRRTFDHLAKLNERLVLIDSAQRNIAELSSKVVSLKDILANKQARGAFGQIRMESIVADALPKGAYSFQPTLSNGKRPDCLIHMPNGAAGIAVDAKFPLEGFEAFREAMTDEARSDAQSRIRRDVSKHIDDIAAKYLIAGETQDTAMLFVPAESVYAELHESFPDLIQKAYRQRVAIVSPNMLMLAVQTTMMILKDVRMGEQAGLIGREAGLLVEEVARLRDRALEFQRHFAQLGPDLEKIVTSTGKITARAHRLEAGADEKDDAPPIAAQ
jgi:DNA recombination protein RmuC